MRAHPADRFEEELALSTLPTVVTRLVSLYSSEDYSVDEVAHTLEGDPTVCARTLRLANSAYYGFSGRVGTIRRAVALLGGATVQAVALAATVLRAWAEGAPPAEVESLWHHAYLCAVACRHAARRLPPEEHRSSPDTLFLVGLLHDVGKFVFLTREPREYAELLRTVGTEASLRDAERDRYGRDHAEAGGQILEAWSFPTPMSASVRYRYEGDLRAEFRPDWEVLEAAHRAVGGEEPPEGGAVSPHLFADLQDLVERSRPEAEAFYRAVA